MLACDDDQARARYASEAEWARETLADPAEVTLEASFRYGGDLLDAAQTVLAGTGERPDSEAPGRGGRDLGRLLALREQERAEAQAIAREIESVLAQGEARIDRICVAVPPGGSRERTIAAALEERRVLRAAGRWGVFQRPEVRDVIAWLRLLADHSRRRRRGPRSQPASGRAAIG